MLKRTSVVVLACAILATVLAGCSSGRSVEAYCRTFKAEGEAFHSYLGSSSDDPFTQIIKIVGAPQQLAIAFDKLDKVAPEDIEPDVAVLQKAFQYISDHAADNVDNPLKAIAVAIQMGANTQPSYDRVNQYTTQNCRNYG